MFHASHCLGLSTKVCSRFPQVEFFGPPVSVSAGASDSVPLRLSNRLVMQPDRGSIFRRMNSFSSESAEAFNAVRTGGATADARTKYVAYPREGVWASSKKRARCVS